MEVKAREGKILLGILGMLCEDFLTIVVEVDLFI